MLPIYQALYRKWRPQRFEEVVGQEGITTALANQILADKIGHAYLFTGTRGTGKTTCAKVFAKAVNCEAREGAEPCGKCPMCVGLDNGSILDVVEIDAASNNGVDDVRELREETAYRPSRGRFRVYIIDEVHMLSTAAFNALLKTLEEPPSHVIFILATTESHKVPATILSRCQRFDFVRIPADKIAGRLRFVAEQEKINLTEDAADLIARLADGAMRDALSLLDTCAGLGRDIDEALVREMAGVTDKSYLFDISEAARSGGAARLLELVANLHAGSIDVRRLCEELVHHYRNLFLASLDKGTILLEDVPKQDQQKYLDTAGQMSEKYTMDAIRRLAAAMDSMGRSPDPRVELELALFDIAEMDSEGQAPVAQPVMVPAPKPAVKEAPKAVSAPAEPPNTAEPAPVEEPPIAEASDETTDAAETKTETEAEASEDHPIPFAAWADVLQRMSALDKLIYSYMSNSTAYTDGKRVLIDGGDMFITFMRTNKVANERIKTVIAEVTGHRYGLGPYTPPKAPAAAPQKQEKTLGDTLEEWEALGIEIEKI